MGEHGEASRVQEVLEPLLRHQGVSARFTATTDVTIKEVLRPPVDGEGLIARIFIDLREPRAIALYMSNARAQSFTFREIRVDVGKDELAREATGAIIDAAVRILLAGGSLELSREQAEHALAGDRPPAQPAARPPSVHDANEADQRTTNPRSFRAMMFYGATAFASGDHPILHGPGIGVELMPDRLFYPTLSLQYQVPTTFEGAVVGARIQTVAGRAGAGWTLAKTSTARISLGLSAGADLIWLSPVVIDSARADSGTSRLVAAAMLRPSLSWQRELGELGLGATALVDIDLLGTQYTATSDGRELVILAPWRARPGLAVFVAW